MCETSLSLGKDKSLDLINILLFDLFFPITFYPVSNRNFPSLDKVLLVERLMQVTRYGS